MPRFSRNRSFKKNIFNVTISLTESGEESFKSIEESMNSYYENVYNHISNDKKEQVLESMEILLKAISKI